MSARRAPAPPTGASSGRRELIRPIGWPAGRTPTAGVPSHPSSRTEPGNRHVPQTLAPPSVSAIMSFPGSAFGSGCWQAGQEIVEHVDSTARLAGRKLVRQALGRQTPNHPCGIELFDCAVPLGERVSHLVVSGEPSRRVQQCRSRLLCPGRFGRSGRLRALGRPDRHVTDLGREVPVWPQRRQRRCGDAPGLGPAQPDQDRGSLPPAGG